MGTDPVVLKELQVDQGIPRGVTFGKGMGLAGQSIEPIAQGAVDPLNVNSSRWDDHLTQGRADFDREQLAMLIAMLDGLRQAHIGRDHQSRTSGLAGAHRLTVGTGEDRRIAPPAITAPRQRMALCTRDGEGHRSLDQIVTDASSCAGSDEAAGAILHETSPALASIGFAGSPVFCARRTKTRRFRRARGADPA